MYLHVFLPAQEQGLLSITSLNDCDGKIACSAVYRGISKAVVLQIH